MAGGDQCAQEQFLRAVIERIQRHGASGRPDGRLGVACGQQAQRCPAKLLHRPGRALAPGHHEPDVKCRAVARLYTLQQRPGYLRGGQRTVPQRPDVNPQAPVSQADGIAAQQPRVLTAAAQVS